MQKSLIFKRNKLYLSKMKCNTNCAKLKFLQHRNKYLYKGGDCIEKQLVYGNCVCEL